MQETGIMEQLKGCESCPFWNLNGSGCGRFTPIDECEVYKRKETSYEKIRHNNQASSLRRL